VLVVLALCAWLAATAFIVNRGISSGAVNFVATQPPLEAKDSSRASARLSVSSLRATLQKQLSSDEQGEWRAGGEADDRQRHEAFMQRYANLFDGYTGSNWWFGIFDVAETIILAIITAGATGVAQPVLQMLVMLALFGLLVWRKIPFVERRQGRAKVVLRGTQALSLLLLIIGASSTSVSMSVIGAMVGIVNLAGIFYLAALQFVATIQTIKGLIDEKRGGKNAAAEVQVTSSNKMVVAPAEVATEIAAEVEATRAAAKTAPEDLSQPLPPAGL